MNKLLTQLQSNWAALAGLVIIWLVYRLGKADERQGVIRGLREELRLHALWVGTPYPPPQTIPADWQDLSKMVYKLGTIAIDNAISRGPGLFLNHNLVSALVAYRQVLGHMHQLIDSAMALQTNPEMWRTNPPPSLRKKMIELTVAIHVLGIGTETSGEAHQHFRQLRIELQNEQDTKLLPMLWILIGINLYPLKPGLLRYL